jgi:hypothetical protein
MKNTQAIRDDICMRLGDGESLASICRDPDMPAWSTVHEWLNEECGAFSGQVTRAREQGYMVRADEAIRAAKTADDAAKGRLAFDAERWYLGKLSNAFRDKNSVELTGRDGGPVEVSAIEWRVKNAGD